MADRIVGYATGLVEIARAEGQLERVESELFQLGRALEGSQQLMDTLSDRAVPADRRQGIIDDLLSSRASELTTGLVGFVVGLGRASELPAIIDAFVAAAAAGRNRQVAEVRSAVVLDDETKTRLADALGRVTGKEVEVKVIVDPDVVGGLSARVGDTVIDGTLRRRLTSLREALGAQESRRSVDG